MNNIKFWTILIVLLLQKMFSDQKDEQCIQILHMNDIFSKFDEQCGRILNNKCYGGFSRIGSWVQDSRKKDDFTLFLNAGDTSTGHLWHTLFRENITSRFLNLVDFDAMSLGEAEFHDGLKSLSNLLSLLNENTKVLAANIDTSQEPLIHNLNRIKRSHIFKTSDNFKIGIIGYLSPETANNFYLGEIEIKDEIMELIKEARYLKFVENCNFIIALGHSGFKKDKEIAKHVEYINLIVGGHSKTFLYSRDSFTSHLVYRDNFESSYPHVIHNKFGKQVLIVQAYTNTKYIGNMKICFDKVGKMSNYSGFPMILNDKTAKKDSNIQEVILEYKAKLHKLETDVIDTNKTLKDNRVKICKRRECPVGNLVADAFLYYFEQKEYNDSIDGAVVHSGAFRRKLSFEYLDALKLVSFFTKSANLHILHLNGETIWNMFKNSGRNLHKSGFLQVSKNIKVVYLRHSYTKLELSEIFINGNRIRLNEIYTFVLGSHVRRGRDGYDIIKKLDEENIESIYDFEALKLFLSTNQDFGHNEIQRIIIKNNGFITLYCPNYFYKFTFYFFIMYFFII